MPLGLFLDFSKLLVPDLRFSLGQTNIRRKFKLKYKHDLHVVYHRFAKIFHERRCRKLLKMKWRKNSYNDSKDEDASKLAKSPIPCCLYFHWLPDPSQTRLNIQQWNASILDSFALLRQNLKENLCEKVRGINGVNFSSTEARTKVLASFESQRFKLTWIRLLLIDASFSLFII